MSALIDSVSLFLKWWWQGLTNIFDRADKRYLIKTTESGLEFLLPNQSLLNSDAASNRLKNKNWFFVPEENQVLSTEIPSNQIRQSDKTIVESLTPFGFDEVFFSITNDRKQLAVVSKKQIENQLQKINDESFNLQGIIFHTQQGQQTDQLKQPKSQHLTAISILALILFVIWGGLKFANHRAQQYQSQLQAQLIELAPTKPITTLSEQQSESVQQYTQNLLSKRTNALNSIGQLLSDDTTIEQLLINSDELVIDGSSSNASSLLKQLQKSEFLDEVEFVTAISLDKKTQIERFKISAKLVAGGKSE